MKKKRAKKTKSSPKPLLQVNKLSVCLRGTEKKLLDQVSFTINKGEIFSLVGESGSGKSLTALSIMRLLPEALRISAGSIELNQSNVFDLPEIHMNRVRGKKIAMIFQEPQTALNPVQTIGKQIAEVFSLHEAFSSELVKQKALELLGEVGIPQPDQRIDWYPHQLSGGQKQRVMIAMALACEPDLLIADEPTTALDVTIQKQILDLLKALCKKRQQALLLITHDMGIVSLMADTVGVMHQGKLIEIQSTADFFKNPKKDYSRKLLDSIKRNNTVMELENNSPLLRLSDVRIWFPIRKGLFQRTVGYTKAVDGVSLEINQGETLALVGESGCGKTTLGLALLGLTTLYKSEEKENETKGETKRFIEFYRDNHFHRIDNLGTKDFSTWRKDIQIIFQDPFSSMNPRFTVYDIIEEGLLYLQPELSLLERKLKIESLMERVGLEQEHLSRYPHEFSGGQRQRIAIARALAVQPKLIICDEPTSALDVAIREQILSLLKTLQEEEGLSYLFITHDLSLVPRIAHRVAVMKEGKIIEQGGCEQVMQSPQHAYTQELLAAAPELPN